MTTANAVGQPEYLTTEEVAEILRTSPESVRFWRHAGQGPRSFRLGRRILYYRADLEEFIAEVRDGDRLAARREALRAAAGTTGPAANGIA